MLTTRSIAPHRDLSELLDTLGAIHDRILHNTASYTEDTLALARTIFKRVRNQLAGCDLELDDGYDSHDRDQNAAFCACMD